MPEDVEGFADEAPEVTHDDIMKRLLAYRQRLRGELAAAGVPEDPGVATATEELVDVGGLEEERHDRLPPLEPFPPARAFAPPTPAPGGSSDLPTRVAELESTLARLEGMLGELRRRFQELAVVVDERIAAIRDAALQARREDRAE